MASASTAKCILLVDDEADAVSVLERSLLKKGFNVTSFTDPLKALDAFRSNCHCYNIVITDIRMDKMNGIELAKHLRIISSHVKILLMTAYEMAAVGSEGELESLGVSELLKKPLTGNELISVISKLLPSSQMLETVYICRDCKTTLIFESDVQDHTYRTGHKQFYDMSFDSFLSLAS
jgi:CheY-like chemotaxis protein